jgi:anti-anti-sigma regulatory factor
VRSSGTVDTSGGFGLSDHLCWAYDDRAELRDAAHHFLADGLALGQRIRYVGAATVEVLRGELEGFTDIDALIGSGAAEVVSLSDMYWSTAIGPAEQVAAYADATSEAVAAGYTGLRVVADATELVLDPAGRDDFIRYEHLIDRSMADGLAFAAMCAYDVERVGEVIGELECVHPVVNRSSLPFRVIAAGPAQLSIHGEVDAMYDAEFDTALRRVLYELPGTLVEVDCSALRFIDHRGLHTLDRAAHAAAVELHLASAPVVASRVVQVFDLDALRIDPR